VGRPCRRIEQLAALGQLEAEERGDADDSLSSLEDTERMRAVAGRAGCFSQCHSTILAEMEKAKRHWKQALVWVEKGLALEPTRNWHNEAALSLDHMKPDILSHLGRKEDALAQSWADFEKRPSEFGYEAFMRYVPKGEKSKWHSRAMDESGRD